MTKRFITAFAEVGDRESIPDSPSGNSVNYQTGYTSQYEEDPETSETALFPERDEFNQILNDVTGNIKEWQENLYPVFIEASENGGDSFSYSLGMIVSYSGLNYISNEDDNTDTPTVGDGAESWSEYVAGSGGGDTLVSMPNPTSIGVDVDALSSSTGFGVTSIGIGALESNTSGFRNTALGNNALQSNTNGGNNTASGYNALSSNEGGFANTATGNSSLEDNVSGSGNTATGDGSLRGNTTGSGNTANGSASLDQNTTGSSNTATGAQAMQLNTVGNNNTATGVRAMQFNTVGEDNCAFGIRALTDNTTGENNVAIGSDSLTNNTIASNNSALGYRALFSNTTGGGNTATGFSALSSNTTGFSNSAVGLQSLQDNTTGSSNSAVGISSLRQNTTGTGNAAVGILSLGSNTIGSNNSALGRTSLSSNSSGSQNTAIGYSALSNNTTGSGNTAISPRDSGGSYFPVFDPTTEDNRFCAGSTSVTNAYIQVPWTVVSDARDKTNFTEIEHGLDFVNKLNPVSYQFRKDRESEEVTGNVKYGFKAQEVLALEGDNPVIIDNEDDEKLRMIDTALIPVLVKSIQDLTSIIESQQKQIDELKGK